MPAVRFTSQLERFLSAPVTEVTGATIREVFDRVFTAHRTLRGYILDDQGALRQHVQVFVDGMPVRDRYALSDTVGPDSEIYVFQALSGG